MARQSRLIVQTHGDPGSYDRHLTWTEGSQYPIRSAPNYLRQTLDQVAWAEWRSEMPWLWDLYIIILLELKPSSTIANHRLHSEVGWSRMIGSASRVPLTVSSVAAIYGTQATATWNDRLLTRNEGKTRAAGRSIPLDCTLCGTHPELKSLLPGTIDCLLRTNAQYSCWFTDSLRVINLWLCKDDLGLEASVSDPVSPNHLRRAWYQLLDQVRYPNYEAHATFILDWSPQLLYESIYFFETTLNRGTWSVNRCSSLLRPLLLGLRAETKSAGRLMN